MDCELTCAETPWRLEAMSMTRRMMIRTPALAPMCLVLREVRKVNPRMANTKPIVA